MSNEKLFSHNNPELPFNAYRQRVFNENPVPCLDLATGTMKPGYITNYTAYKVNLDGTLSHKEHLNDIVEVNDWLDKFYGQYVTVKIFSNRGSWRLLTDNGNEYEIIAKS